MEVHPRFDTNLRMTCPPAEGMWKVTYQTQ